MASEPAFPSLSPQEAWNLFIVFVEWENEIPEPFHFS